MELEGSNVTEEQKWQFRRFRHLLQYGIKSELVEEELYRTGAEYLEDLTVPFAIPSTPCSARLPNDSPQTRLTDSGIFMSPYPGRKESAIKVVYDALSSLIQGSLLHRKLYGSSESKIFTASHISVRNPQNLHILPNSFPDSIQGRLNFETTDENFPSSAFQTQAMMSYEFLSHENESDSSSQSEISIDDELFFDLKPLRSKNRQAIVFKK